MSGETTGADQVAAALGCVEAALGEAADAVWALSDQQLLDALDTHEQLAARTAGLGVALAGEADRRGLAGLLGAPSTSALLRHRLRLHPGEASARVRLAGNPELAATRAALDEGRLSAAHARVIEQAVRTLPPTLEPQVRAEGQAFLIDHAEVFDPGQLGRLAQHLHQVVDPDGAAGRERAAQARRELSTADRGDGTFAVRGTLSNEDHARLMAALAPLAAPQPQPDGSPDRRTPAQRRGDALMRIIDQTLDAGDRLPTRRGARPHLTITAGLDTLLGLPGAPAADTTWGGPVTADTLRRIACDAAVTAVFVDQYGVPLDVGRETRTVPPGMWAALVVRDRGCVFPGCTRPADWTEAHHIRHWADGGRTALDNLALLCAHHHKVVHHHGWDIAIAEDGHPHLIPPPWIDPDRTPRRNPHLRLRL